MKILAAILGLIALIPALGATEPANFKFMLRGYCYAGNRQVDHDAPGGYGRSSNFPQILDRNIKPREPGLYLEIQESPEVTFADRHTGITVRLVNGGRRRLSLDAMDSRLSIIQEALMSDGNWKPVEYLPSSWCGNSYHHVYLPASHYWEFIAPRYTGTIPCQIRFALQIDQNTVIHSPAYEGGINPEQLSEKQGHNAENIMDPYND